ncbi:MAG: ABC transporter permease [Anaerolineae bacterium]|nr:ABC transporter permease [Anaerolineae bacterium]
MFRYVLLRLLYLIPTVLLVSFFTFAVGFYGPGDPIKVMMKENWNDEKAYQALREKYGFDRPFLVQYADYMVNAAKGDFGRSVLRVMPVRDLMFPALGVTAQLGLLALVSLAVFGIGLGVLAAVKQNTWVDYLIITVSIALQSVPVFVLAPILMIIVVLQLHLMNTPAGWDGILSSKVILPVFLLTGIALLTVVRQTREAVIQARQSDYVRTARAKGLPERLVLWRHILKNALTPVLTTLGLLTGWLLTGSIFIETIFSIPGFGSLYWGALKTRDYPVLIGTTLVVAIIIMLTNLIVDLCYSLLDPRVRVEQ